MRFGRLTCQFQKLCRLQSRKINLSAGTKGWAFFRDCKSDVSHSIEISRYTTQKPRGNLCSLNHFGVSVASRDRRAMRGIRNKWHVPFPGFPVLTPEFRFPIDVLSTFLVLLLFFGGGGNQNMPQRICLLSISPTGIDMNKISKKNVPWELLFSVKQGKLLRFHSKISLASDEVSFNPLPPARTLFQNEPKILMRPVGY